MKVQKKKKGKMTPLLGQNNGEWSHFSSAFSFSPSAPLSLFFWVCVLFWVPVCLSDSYACQLSLGSLGVRVVLKAQHMCVLPAKSE